MAWGTKNESLASRMRRWTPVYRARPAQRETVQYRAGGTATLGALLDLWQENKPHIMAIIASIDGPALADLQNLCRLRVAQLQDLIDTSNTEQAWEAYERLLSDVSRIPHNDESNENH